MAQIVLTFNDSLLPRISTAFGDALALGRDATAAEVKSYLIGTMKSVVQTYEYRQAQANVQTPPEIDVA